LKVINEVSKHSKQIKKSIKKFGYFAEHNYLHYMHCETTHDKNVFFDYGKDRGLLMQYDEKGDIWSLFPCGILAPDSERLEMLLDAAKYVLKKKKAKKFSVEVSEDVRKGLLKKLKTPNGLRVCTYTEILYWPVYNLDSWSPKLKGSKMKKLRNIKNRFYKKYKVRVTDSRKVPKAKLKQIFSNWMKKRAMNDSVEDEYYLNLIENNFSGVDMAKTLYVNGKPSTITVGWKIPNSNNYYSAVGIVDYSYEGLGEVANIDDLNRLRRKGYDYVDFGGSDKVLLRFKKKFKPEQIYKTYIFSIVRR